MNQKQKSGMIEQLIDIYERVKHARESMRHLRVVAFGESGYNFYNTGEAIAAMKRRNDELTDIHEKIRAYEEKLEDKIYRIIKSYLGEHGDGKTALLLYRIKKYSPLTGSECYYEILEILRLKGEKTFLRDLDYLAGRASLGIV